MLRDDSARTIFDILTFCRSEGLLTLDERLEAHLNEFDPTAPIDEESDDDVDVIAVAMQKYFATSANQIYGYRKYLEDLSPFATQQGIKGAEFARVITVCDDEEGRHRQFSYNKYFGIVPLSETDEAHIAAGEESTLDRTRRLFYVCCSRAAQSLAVVLFADDPQRAATSILAMGLLPTADIHILT